MAGKYCFLNNRIIMMARVIEETKALGTEVVFCASEQLAVAAEEAFQAFRAGLRLGKSRIFFSGV